MLGRALVDFHLPHARHHAHQTPDGAELFDLLHLREKILQGEVGLAHLFGHFLRLLLVDHLGSLLH